MGNFPEEMLNKVMLEVKEQAFLTGSRAFGLESKGSDWDYVIPLDFPYNAEDFCLMGASWVDEDGVAPPEYDPFNEACYIEWEGEMYNLIFPYEKDAYDSWVTATRFMLRVLYGMPKRHELGADAILPEWKAFITDRKWRVHIFRSLRQELQGISGDENDIIF